ncbi:M13 family metallopeptidase [Undibacterium cyanobacteriorum]|uniref:M13 family metallopeptidase n=1 Tax=Undibacterium cyanobacteriorum TaxID=3073561 RepID=A0ABY9RMD7_9BURK|nr:M13 family metallopeptidase [Undibacterium sp. 20NA77.5]WMW82364.1 M13 family metallopeptidase [Undibacterium sp. 20NA77.5]
MPSFDQFTLRSSQSASFAILISALLTSHAATWANGITTSSESTVLNKAPANQQQVIRPQDDLYMAANHEWLNKTNIPANKTEVYAIGTPAIVQQRISTLLQSLSSKKHIKGSIEKKLADYYASYIDLKTIDRVATQQIQSRMQEIDRISNLEQLAQWQGQQHGIIKLPIWLWGGFADFANPGIYRNIAMQGGLGLPSREMYLEQKAPSDAAKNSKESASALHTAYLEYLTALARSGNIDHPEMCASRVFELERRIAAIHTPEAQAMNPAALQTIEVTKLDQFAPGFPWRSMLNAAKVSTSDSINIMQVETFKGLGKLYQDTQLDDWKMYFKLRMLNEMAPVASASMRRAHFNFHGQTSQGLTSELPRPEQAIKEVNGAMSEALAKTYVAQHFPESHKQKVAHMIENLIAAGKDSIRHSNVMSESTRTEALRKLSKLTARIGYPDKWRDYSRLDIIAGDAIGNQQRAKRFEWERQAALSGTKIDRGIWMMSPIEVNAYYDPSLNEINLPAAFLQAPMFDPQASDAANYGRLGAFIGHEISHGFDNIGAQFNADGMMKNWWSEQDSDQFQEKSKQLVDFYNRQEILPGKFVNGSLTLPENMADIIGLQMAYKAYVNQLMGRQARLDANKLRQAKQSFFIENAKGWAVLRRDQRTLELLMVDPHSPHKVRSNAPVMHVDGFHEAFSTKPGDALYLAPEQRFRLW